MNIPARTEEILAGIHADVTATLRFAIGRSNDQDLRDAMANAISKDLYAYEETRSAIVLCDEDNNPLSVVERGRLHVDSVFVLDNISFQGIYEIMPPPSYQDDPDPVIKIEFFVRKTREVAERQTPERKVYYVDTGSVPHANTEKYLSKIREAIRASYADMPVALQQSLKV